MQNLGRGEWRSCAAIFSWLLATPLRRSNRGMADFTRRKDLHPPFEISSSDKKVPLGSD
jgi:hypothetical protein